MTITWQIASIWMGTRYTESARSGTEGDSHEAIVKHSFYESQADSLSGRKGAAVRLGCNENAGHSADER